MESSGANAAAIRHQRQGCRLSCVDSAERTHWQAGRSPFESCSPPAACNDLTTTVHQRKRLLPQAVRALDLLFGEATDARQRPAAVRNSNGNQNLVGPRCVVHANLHTV